MKTGILLAVLGLLCNLSIAQSDFDSYFIDKSLRFDYTIAGNKDIQQIYFEQLKEEKFWGGSIKNLIDTLNRGDYRICIYSHPEGKLIYSRGYSDLFFEWQDTEEAKHMSRSYYGSAVFPFPKDSIRLEIHRRKYSNQFSLLYKQLVNPLDYSIQRTGTPDYKVHTLFQQGDPHTQVDIVILPEGYQADEMKKFKEDAARFMNYFFENEPFKTYQKKFNIYLVLAASAESGTDIPGRNQWKNTLLNSHFFTFGSDRYLTTRDVKGMRDLAACAPYDQIYVLVNSSYYGGGGIFNFYSLATSDNPESPEVFVHEFGHAFAALADEYAYEDTPVESLYNPAEENWHPNISNMVDLSLKWGSRLDSLTPVPTPIGPNSSGKIGVYEGAGYVQRGMYRPYPNCRMRSNHAERFCAICEEEIIRMIQFYTE